MHIISPSTKLTKMIYISAVEFKPIHKFVKVTISSINYAKNINIDTLAIHAYNNSPYKITRPLVLIRYFETKASFYPA